MTDPLSLAASIITILGVVKSSIKAKETFNIFRHASTAFNALYNELSEIHLQISSLEGVLNTMKDRPKDAANLQNLLQRIKNALFELEFYLQELSPIDRTKISRRLTWTLHQRKILYLKDNLRVMRQELITSIATINLTYTTQMQVQVQNVEILTHRMHAKLDRLAAPEIVTTPEHKIASNLLNASTSSSTDAPEMKASNDEWTLVCSVSRAQDQHECQCSCVCHCVSNYSAIPTSLRWILGTLFIGYSVHPVYKRPCDIASCSRSSQTFLKVQYQFPSQFCNLVISAWLHGSFKCVDSGIRIATVVPTLSPVLNHAYHGQTHALIRLLNTKSASPNDMDAISGWTPLHHAVNMARFDVCRVLLQRGADPFLKNRFGESAIDRAWIHTISGAHPSHIIAEYKALFSNVNSLEYHHLPKLHRMVLGFDERLNEQNVKQYIDVIDERDSVKHTALTWATSRQDRRLVRLLLQHGADPRVPQNWPSLRTAAQQGDPVILKMLVDSGAPINAQNQLGKTALHVCVVFGLDLALLLLNGADTEARDYHGRTALSFAADHNRGDMIQTLYHYGADINAEDDIGYRPIHFAMERNLHESLGALLELDADLLTATKEGETTLGFIFNYADNKTIDLYIEAEPLGLWKAAAASGQAELFLNAAQLPAEQGAEQDCVAAWAKLIHLLRDLDRAA